MAHNMEEIEEILKMYSKLTPENKDKIDLLIYSLSAQTQRARTISNQTNKK